MREMLIGYQFDGLGGPPSATVAGFSAKSKDLRIVFDGAKVDLQFPLGLKALE
jgi:hypothetical protein